MKGFSTNGGKNDLVIALQLYHRYLIEFELFWKTAFSVCEKSHYL